MIWTPYDWLNEFYNFYMAALVGIISRYGLTIEACHRNQAGNIIINYIFTSKLFKTVVNTYVSNKTEWFSYKSGCGIHTCNKALEEELTWNIDSLLVILIQLRAIKNKVVLNLK